MLESIHVCHNLKTMRRTRLLCFFFQIAFIYGMIAIFFLYSLVVIDHCALIVFVSRLKTRVPVIQMQSFNTIGTIFIVTNYFQHLKSCHKICFYS